MKTWIQLRTVLDGLEAETDYNSIDQISQRILEWIFVRNHRKDDPLHVQEIVMKSDVASPATVHKSLANLEASKLISISVDAHDTRRRIVTTTPQAEKLFSKLSKGVDAWAKSIAASANSRGGDLAK